MARLRGTETEINLRAAFAAESQAALRYRYFAQQADVDGQPELAALLKSAAEQEAGHALELLDFILEVADPMTGQPIDSARSSIEAAVATETLEGTSTYLDAAATARSEDLGEIAEWLEAMARAEAALAGRLAAGIERAG